MQQDHRLAATTPLPDVDTLTVHLKEFIRWQTRDNAVEGFKSGTSAENQSRENTHRRSPE
jgi:hypothetical protein